VRRELLTWPFAVEKPKKKLLPRKGGFGVDGSRGRRKMVGRVGGAGLGSLKMGEDERKGRAPLLFFLWFWPGKRGLEEMVRRLWLGRISLSHGQLLRGRRKSQGRGGQPLYTGKGRLVAAPAVLNGKGGAPLPQKNRLRVRVCFCIFLMFPKLSTPLCLSCEPVFIGKMLHGSQNWSLNFLSFFVKFDFS
jgi:hypothetical protein